MNKNKNKIVIWHLYELWSKISYEVHGFDWNDAHCCHRFAYIYANCHWFVCWVHMEHPVAFVFIVQKICFFVLSSSPSDNIRTGCFYVSVICKVCGRIYCANIGFASVCLFLLRTMWHLHYIPSACIESVAWFSVMLR